MQRGDQQAVEPADAGQRVLAQLGDQLRAADGETRLRPAEQLVPAERDDVGAGIENLAHRDLVVDAQRPERGEIAAAPINDQRLAALGRQPRQRSDLRLVGEADDLEVARVHLEDRPGARADRVAVVRQARLVRRADLAQLAARRREDVGHAERAADLDQLAARDDDLLVAGQRAQREHDRGGVVVHDDEAGVGKQLGHQIVEVTEPVSPAALFESVFEVGVVLRGHGQAGRGFGGQDRPPEVGVDDHAGRVDHPARPRNQQVPGPRGDRPGDRGRPERALEGPPLELPADDSGPQTGDFGPH